MGDALASIHAQHHEAKEQCQLLTTRLLKAQVRLCRRHPSGPCQ
jgi:hypothetical protein